MRSMGTVDLLSHDKKLREPLGYTINPAGTFSYHAGSGNYDYRGSDPFSYLDDNYLNYPHSGKQEIVVMEMTLLVEEHLVVACNVVVEVFLLMDLHDPQALKDHQVQKDHKDLKALQDFQDHKVLIGK